MSGPPSLQSRYGLVDAAQDPRLRATINNLAPDARCLVDDSLDPAMAAALPWLVPLPPDSAFLRLWQAQGKGRAWGFIFDTAVPMDVVRRHFKKLLHAQLPDHSVVYFRFYDPRVLRIYLRNAEPKERRYFFGPITKIYYEDDATGRPVTALPEA